jgi:hypothetical protein
MGPNTQSSGTAATPYGPGFARAYYAKELKTLDASAKQLIRHFRDFYKSTDDATQDALMHGIRALEAQAMCAENDLIRAGGLLLIGGIR